MHIISDTDTKKVVKQARLFKSIADSLSSMVAYWGADLRCRYANQAYLEWFGKAPEDLIGKSILDLMGEKLFALNEPHIRAALEGIPQEFERTLTKADGSTGYTWATYTPNFDSKGIVEGFTVFVTDITALKEAEAKKKQLTVAINTTRDGVWIMNTDGVLLEANQSYSRIIGYSVDELRGMRVSQLEAIEDQKEVEKHFAIIMSQGHDLFETRHRHKDGHEIDMEVSVSFIPETQTLISYCRDITIRKLADRDLRVAAATFESHDAVMITDTDGFIIKVNKAFTTITGFSAEEAVGRNPRFLKSGRHDKTFYVELFQKLHCDGKWEGEIWDKRKNGEVFPMRMVITAIKDAKQKIIQYVSLSSDITERKNNEELINKFAFYDPLTELPNRRMLTDRLSQAMASNKRHSIYGALMVMDMDKFKSLNDTYGHVAGDLLLVEVGQRIKSCIRESDTVARFGGDEFVVMLSELNEEEATSRNEARIVAEKIRVILAETYFLKSNVSSTSESCIEHNCSSSIGVSLFNGNEVNQEAIFKQADKAMYKAKEIGRNLVCFFDPSLN